MNFFMLSIIFIASSSGSFSVSVFSLGKKEKERETIANLSVYQILCQKFKEFSVNRQTNDEKETHSVL